jgi:hypothetical protein
MNSNQYGYIPSNKVHLLQEEYSIANPTTWQFQKEEITYGGVEENEFSHAQKDEIIALGGQWFATAQDFLTWLNPEE